MSDMSVDLSFNAPDVETASPGYSGRFRGDIGEYFLDVQRDLVKSLLGHHNDMPLSVLEVGGAHGQLTPMFLENGHGVVVQCSALIGFAMLNNLRKRHADRLKFVVSSLGRLPFPDKSFDVVIMIRLLSHVTEWQHLIAECARVARCKVIFDYPPRTSFNALSPLLFPLKRRLEGNTRRYACFDSRQLRDELSKHGFGRFQEEREYFLPMVVHRACKMAPASRGIERICRAAKFTSIFGSPVLMCAERTTEL